MRLTWAALAVGLFLSACATTAPVRPTASTRATAPSTLHPHGTPIPPPRAAQPSAPVYAHELAPPPPAPVPAQTTTTLASLPGWAEEDHVAALAAFQAGCGVARDPAMGWACARARAMGRADEVAARNFFETSFRAEWLGPAGVLTAYFAPEYPARATPDAEFSAPVRPKPATRPTQIAPTPSAPDLTEVIDGALADPDAPLPLTTQPSASSGPVFVNLATAERADIDRASPEGALAWMRPEDLFFLQIQGSGVLTFPNGARMKATYAADNGRPFVAIARPMVQRGLLRGAGASGEAIRAWLADHRGAQAEAVMTLNPRYVFFNLSSDDGHEPAGAAGVPLPPGRAIAVDPSRHAYGELYWIDAAAPVLSGAAKVYRRVAMALDTGSAIRGEVRADLYVGSGSAAGAEAGRVRHTLKMVRLVPLPSLSAQAQAQEPGRARGEAAFAAR